MAVEIKKSVIEAQVESGMKKKELAEFYELPVTQMTKVLQQLGLRIKQNHLPKFVIVDDEKPTITTDLNNTTKLGSVVVETTETNLVTESEW